METTMPFRASDFGTPLKPYIARRKEGLLREARALLDAGETISLDLLKELEEVGVDLREV